MNESDLTTVFERATERLTPDIGELVAGGADRGRASLRRRRVGTTIGSLAAVAAVGLGAVLLAPGAEPRVTDAGVASAGTGAAAVAGQQRALADPAVVEKRLLALLPDDKVVDDLAVVDAGPEPGLDGIREIELHLDGAQVQISVFDFTMDPAALKKRLSTDPGPKPAGCDASMIDDDAAFRRYIRDGVKSLNSARGKCWTWIGAMREQRCAASASCIANRTAYSPARDCKEGHHVNPCRELPDGSWIWPRAGSGDGFDGGVDDEMTATARYTTDGWYVDVSAFTVDDHDSFHPTLMADEPPLTLEQTTEIAASDIWFQ